VRALIAHLEVDWRAQTKNRIAINNAYHSLSGICREGREVLRPPSHHRHSTARSIRMQYRCPHPTFTGINSAGFSFPQSLGTTPRRKAEPYLLNNPGRSAKSGKR